MINWLGVQVANSGEPEKDGKTLHIRKGIIKDETGSKEIVLFGSLVNENSNNIYPDFKKIKVQKFMDGHIFEMNWNYKSFKNWWCYYICNWQRI